MNGAQAWAQGAHGLYLYTLTEQELHDCSLYLKAFTLRLNTLALQTVCCLT